MKPGLLKAEMYAKNEDCNKRKETFKLCRWSGQCACRGREGERRKVTYSGTISLSGNHITSSNLPFKGHYPDI